MSDAASIRRSMISAVNAYGTLEGKHTGMTGIEAINMIRDLVQPIQEATDEEIEGFQLATAIRDLTDSELAHLMHACSLTVVTLNYLVIAGNAVINERKELFLEGWEQDGNAKDARPDCP